MAVYSKDTNLLISEIDELFEKEEGIVNQLMNGKGGEVYIFEGKHAQDWRADGYRYTVEFVSMLAM